MEEMRHIDYGIAVLNADVFTSFPDNQPFDLADVYSRLVSQNQMVAYEVKQRFMKSARLKVLRNLILSCATNGPPCLDELSQEDLRESAEINYAITFFRRLTMGNVARLYFASPDSPMAGSEQLLSKR